MTAKLISAFAPPMLNRNTRDGRNGPGGSKPTRRNDPVHPRHKGFWVGVKNQGYRFLCWLLALLATYLASTTYRLSRVGLLNQRQTCWLLRCATRIHGKSVRMLIGGSW